MSIDENTNEFNKQPAPRKCRRKSRSIIKKGKPQGAARAKQVAPPRTTISTAAKQKARKAYDNAKYRCGKLAGYENTLFLIPSFSAMVIAIGLPRSDQSLDRINPAGHYELGNIRWVSKQVQAVNKCGRRGAALPTIQELVQNAKTHQVSDERRKVTSELWHRAVARLTRACTTADVQSLADELSIGTFPADSFNEYHIPRTDLPPGVFHLPSLTCPAAFVRVRGGPFPTLLSSRESRMHVRERRKRWTRHGIIGPFDKAALRANFLEHELAQLQEDTTGAGACWLGQPSPKSLLAGWFEGKMIAAAGRLAALGKHAAVLPACSAAAEFRDYSASEYDLNCAAVQAHFLFIPDFQVDQGGAWQSDHGQLYLLMRLLKLRGELRRTTFFGVQSLNKLPIAVRDYALCQFSVREIEPRDQLPHPSAEEVRAAAMTAHKRRTGQTSFHRYCELE